MSRRTLCATALTGLRSEDDEDLGDELFEMSDGGAGAESIYASVDRSCFGVDDETFYERRRKAARAKVKYNDESLLEVFDLVVENGKERKESICAMMSRKPVPGTRRNTATGRN